MCLGYDEDRSWEDVNAMLKDPAAREICHCPACSILAFSDVDDMQVTFALPD